MTLGVPSQAPRPREVTVGGVQAIVGSAVALVALVIGMQHLHSSEVTHSLRTLVQDPRVDSLGMTVEAARQLIKYMIMALAVMSAAACVLGLYVLRRHRAARVVLTVLGVLAALVSLFGGPTGWVVTLYIGLCLWQLWTKAARAWFSAGQAGRSQPPGWPPTPPGR